MRSNPPRLSSALSAVVNLYWHALGKAELTWREHDAAVDALVQLLEASNDEKHTLTESNDQ